MNNACPPLNREVDYCLRLANGQGWHFVATEATRPWVKKLALIIELKTYKSNAYSKLIFIKRERGKDYHFDPVEGLKAKIKENLPRKGWKIHNYGALLLWTHSDIPDAICEISLEDNRDLDIISMWLALHPIYQLAQKSGGLLFHAALVEYNGIGVLLAGPGNTGKSTCCRLLSPPWQTLCDDETLIVRNERKRYLAHPFPTWSDYLFRNSDRTWNVERYVPLFAIFFLERAENDGVLPIGQGQATLFINQSAKQIPQPGWPDSNPNEEMALRRMLFENACEIAKAVPSYRLRVSLKGRFWEEMERVLSFRV